MGSPGKIMGSAALLPTLLVMAWWLAVVHGEAGGEEGWCADRATSSAVED